MRPPRSFRRVHSCMGHPARSVRWENAGGRCSRRRSESDSRAGDVPPCLGCLDSLKTAFLGFCGASVPLRKLFRRPWPGDTADASPIFMMNPGIASFPGSTGLGMVLRPRRRASGASFRRKNDLSGAKSSGAAQRAASGAAARERQRLSGAPRSGPAAVRRPRAYTNFLKSTGGEGGMC